MGVGNAIIETTATQVARNWAAPVASELARVEAELTCFVPGDMPIAAEAFAAAKEPLPPRYGAAVKSAAAQAATG